MKIFTPLICLLLFFNHIIIAQNKKTVEATFINTPLTIDGIPDEEPYQNATPAKDFVQIQPHNGSPSFQPSEVYIFYDQDAIYVGAMLYDSSPDSIFNYLTERDHIGMADYFGIYFDPYNEGQLAYGFFVNVAGVQTDLKAIKKEYDYEDGNWNAVWASKTRITDNGWTVEMRIPYSALRFPDKEVHKWGMNMFRNIRRYNSNNSWNFIDREVSGFIHQQGELTGIKNIDPPIRLSFTPYAATYLEYSDNNDSPQFLYKGGMDVKYGISESFTLDMMLIPDFGQIQSDDKQLNLSPYELYYDEKRQFFNEGTELFERGGIFYSRRIGSPNTSSSEGLNTNEVYHSKPTETQLVNATKISGRQKNGFAVGVLNAMSLNSYATLKDTITNKQRDILIQPFTNYNVFVIDQSLKNNSYVSLINTNMSMANSPFYANVTATEFQIRDKSKKYSISGKGGFSYRNVSNNKEGFFSILSLEKNSGKLNFGTKQHVWSDNYNPNDMGYIQRNNELITNTYIDYHITEPFWIYRELHSGFWWDYHRSYNPNEKAGYETGGYLEGLFKNNQWMNINTGVESNRRDYFEPRVKGRYFYKSYNYWLNLNFRTDNRKKLTTHFHLGGFKRPDTKEDGLWGDMDFEWRVGQKLNIEYAISFKNEWNDKGFVDKTDNEDTIYFANRDVMTLVNTLEIAHSFNSNLSLRFRARHYWSGVQNKEFYQLNDNGRLNLDPDYSEDDNNFNAFNIDMTLKWVFAPGSELSFGWKNAILDDEQPFTRNYSKNIDILLHAPQTNTFSLRVLYYIDYNQLRKSKRSNA